MKCFEQITEINFQDLKCDYFDLEHSVFFDIETTGFSPKNSYIYLIGCMYKSGDKMAIKQWFLDDYNTEKELLCDFMNFINSYATLITFNGDNFDIPFVNGRLNRHKILKNLDNFTSHDLYKYASKLKKMLRLPNLKLKTIESFLGINREDVFSGGDLINVYHAYSESKDEKLLKVLLLHNFEDVLAMPTLLNIYAYQEIIDGRFDVTEISINDRNENPDKKEAIISCCLHNNIMSRVSFGVGDYYCTAFGNSLKFKINIYNGELKYFYKDYKDYYYLPDEDRAIHKSVAFYVDKDYRVKAKAATCYSKKTSTFIPQPSELLDNYFKIEYADKTSYIELNEDFINNKDIIKEYLMGLLKYLV